MEYDAKIDLATGASARSKHWKNKKVLWSWLVSKLTTPHHTNENYKQYCSYTKAEQSKIKDVGGYVGGYLRNGRRKPVNVQHRQLITLDIDFAKLDIWENFVLNFDNAAVLHGTHKHSEKTPRYRLVMPISREVSTDEYLAISRAVAGEIGIDLFDNTGFQPERLMFWPSTSKDMEYYAEYQDGPWIDADEILSSYVDWKDSSAWPTSAAHFDKVKSAASKQADPTDKKGIVGSFCRAYSIDEAIDELLKEEYVHCIGDRYTYLKGSAAAGLVTYDGVFAFSHHGTDPCGGKLCNAFDLVRIHKYGHLDEDTTVATARRPSFKEMEAFAKEDGKVKKEIAATAMQAAMYDFAEPIEDMDAFAKEDTEKGQKEKLKEQVAWMEGLDLDSRGNYLSNSKNLNLIFANDPHLQGKFRFNVFNNKRYVFSTVPWRRVPEPEPVKNVDFSGVRNYIETIYGIVGNLKIEDSLALEFNKYRFDPVREYLDSLKWDGVKRIDSFLIDFFGAENTLYSQEAMRKCLVGAVARTFSPGVKFDLVLTIIGGQGTGKSTFVNKLGNGWASDTFTTVSGKEALEQLQGAWLIEIAELAGFRKAEADNVKHFLTKQEDTFRPAYGRTIETFKRRNIFIATTNNRDFLKDPTGNRRFLPILIDEDATSRCIFDDFTQELVDHLWAEAVHLYYAGEPLYMSVEAQRQAKIKQSEHSENDLRRGLIENYLSVKLPFDWDDLILEERVNYYKNDTDVTTARPAEDESIHRRYVCIAEIWCECLGKPLNEMDRYKTRDLNDIVRSLPNWEQSSSTKNFKIYGKQKYYVRLD